MNTPTGRTSEFSLVLDVDLWKTIGDETRSEILRFLCTPERGRMEPYSVSDIAMNFNLTASTVSHHLQLLKRAKLVTVERRGRARYYTLNLDGLHRRVENFNELLNSIDEATQAARP